MLQNFSLFIIDLFSCSSFCMWLLWYSFFIWIWRWFGFNEAILLLLSFSDRSETSRRLYWTPCTCLRTFYASIFHDTMHRIGVTFFIQDTSETPSFHFSNLLENVYKNNNWFTGLKLINPFLCCCGGRLQCKS